MNIYTHTVDGQDTAKQTNKNHTTDYREMKPKDLIKPSYD